MLLRLISNPDLLVVGVGFLTLAVLLAILGASHTTGRTDYKSTNRSVGSSNGRKAKASKDI